MRQLTPEVEDLAKEYNKLQTQRSRLEKESQVLKKSMDDLLQKMVTKARLKAGGVRELSNGSILTVTKVDVAEQTIVRKATSYYRVSVK